MKIRVVAILSILLCLCVIPSAVAEIKGNCEYEEMEDGTLRIIDYWGETVRMEIPKKMDGKVVTSIGDYAFEGAYTLKEVTMPDSIVDIGEYAFSECSALEVVTLPSSLQKMGAYAFADCLNLKRVKFTPGMQEIGEGAFYGCSKLISVSLPGSVQRIGMDAFRDCENLSNLVLNRGLESIESNAFNGCVALEQVDIPDTVTFLGYYAFAQCDSLKRVSLPASIQELESTDGKDEPFWLCPNVNLEVQKDTYAYRVFTGVGMPYERVGNQRLVRHDEWVFLDYEILAEYEGGTTDVCVLEYMGWEESVEISETIFDTCRVVAIADNAFADCEQLQRLTIPASVVQIGHDIFGGRKDVVVCVEPGSCAERYCRENKIGYSILH